MAILKPVKSGDIPERPRSKKFGPKATNQDQTLKVTKISQQLKRQERYSIYINEKYCLSLSEYQLVGSGIRVGKEYKSEELEDLKNESAFGKAYERALNYVMIRPRSKKEIEDYLVRAFMYPKPKSYVDKNGERHFIKQQVNKDQVRLMNERVISRLHEKGYINDEAFAKAWVQSRQLNKKSSRRKLEQELRAKAISTEIITAVMREQGDYEKENLEVVIAKKQRLSKYQDIQKFTQYLLRQGFNYEDIKDALHTRDG